MPPSATRASTASSSMEKSARRGTFATVVFVSRAFASYTENVGGRLRNVRPGPPHASARLNSSSSPPLPTSTWSRSSPFASAIMSRRSLASGSG